MAAKQTVISIMAIAVVTLIVGVAIPKLSVHDTVLVESDFSRDVMQAVSMHYDNPFERLALYLGKSRIIAATSLSAEVESFTLFRIPLGFLRGDAEMKLVINFNSELFD